MSKIKTLEEFDGFIAKELSTEQKAILSFALMYNPKHVEYFISFKTQDFESCKQYILNNKDEISIDKVPEAFLEAANRQIKMFNSLSQKEIDSIFPPC
jgi:hypothetical protein